MMALLASVIANRYVVFTGWTIFMILWETSLVGLMLAVWRLTHHRTSARRHYDAAVAALLAAIMLAVSTPFALLAAPAASPIVRSLGAAAGLRPPAVADRGTDAVPATISRGKVAGSTGAGISPDVVAGAAAIVWAIAAVILAVRLLGGWVLAQRIARKAEPMALPQMTNAIEELRKELQFHTPIRVLQSAAVDAPVVVGWREPALILPDEAASLTSETLTPLLAHEFAHIRRRDYVVNLAQSAIEILLFFSPAVIWISRRIREAREFCCDDAAVTRCRDAKQYVHALTTLAALGAMNTARPALGAAGPRLITRVRRLLQEEPMPTLSSARVAALVSIALVLLAVGMRVSAASAARAPRGDARGAIALQENVPYGWQSSPEGAGVELEKFVSTADAPAKSVIVRNISTAAIVGVQFLATVEQQGRSALNPVRPPVRLFASDLLPVSIPAGQSAVVSPRVLSAEQLQQVAADFGGARIQFFFGLQRVRFANGFEWSITPNPAASAGSDAFNIARPVYSRDLIVRDATAPEVPFGACRDERNRATSHGGMVPILNEPGKFMRCQNSRWVESAGR